MNYRSVLLITEIGADPAAPLAAASALAPAAERLVVTASPAVRASASRPRAAGATAESSLVAWFDGVRAAAAAVAADAEVVTLTDLTPEALDALVDSCGADLVVAGPRPAAAIGAVAELRRRRGVAVLWLPTSAPRAHPALRHVLCVAFGERARGALASFLRDHGDPAMTASVLW